MTIAMPKGDNDDLYSTADTERRREAALKCMLTTPSKPHSESAAKRKNKRN